jgi:hypothetical protein
MKKKLTENRSWTVITLNKWSATSMPLLRGAGADRSTRVHMKMGKIFARLALALALVLIPLAVYAGLPKHLKLVPKITQPPAGKALVNFHRPSNYGGVKYAIFDSDGKMLIDLPGGSTFQMVCDPGQHLFMGWADHVTVVKADVAADKTYDIMIDIGMGWVKANIRLIPLLKGDPRREKLAEFEKREKKVVGLVRTEHVTDYEAKNKTRVEEIRRDFLGGGKSDRVSVMQADDCR